MDAELLTNPAILAALAILALGFVRLRIWWAILRILLAPILRPIPLVLILSALAAAATAMHLGA
jgi:hypothetical protein